MAHHSSDQDDISLLDEENDIEIDSDEVSDEMEEETNHIVKREQKKHKKSYDPRFSVPTYEEKQMMRNADMEVELSLLDIEVSDLTGSIQFSRLCRLNNMWKV